MYKLLPLLTKISSTLNSSTTSSSLKLTSPTIYPPIDTEEFDLEIFTRDRDTDGDSQKDDLEAQIYIDDILYKTVNITDYKSGNKLSGKLKLKGSVKSAEKTISYKDEVLSFSNLGVTNEKLSASKHEATVPHYIIPHYPNTLPITAKSIREYDQL